MGSHTPLDGDKYCHHHFNNTPLDGDKYCHHHFNKKHPPLKCQIMVAERGIHVRKIVFYKSQFDKIVIQVCIICKSSPWMVSIQMNLAAKAHNVATKIEGIFMHTTASPVSLLVMILLRRFHLPRTNRCLE